jgi:hypothetical protein
MRMVRAKKSKLPVISNLSQQDQLQAEEQNVKRCLAAA